MRNPEKQNKTKSTICITDTVLVVHLYVVVLYVAEIGHHDTTELWKKLYQMSRQLENKSKKCSSELQK